MANLMSSVMGAFAEFERVLIRERQREGIALAKQRGVYRGRKKTLFNAEIAELRNRVANGDKKAKAHVARDFNYNLTGDYAWKQHKRVERGEFMPITAHLKA